MSWIFLVSFFFWGGVECNSGRTVSLWQRLVSNGKLSACTITTGKVQQGPHFFMQKLQSWNVGSLVEELKSDCKKISERSTIYVNAKPFWWKRWTNSFLVMRILGWPQCGETLLENTQFFIGVSQVGLGLHSDFDALDASPSEQSWPLYSVKSAPAMVGYLLCVPVNVLLSIIFPPLFWSDLI